VYANGKLVADLKGAIGAFTFVPLSAEARAAFTAGKNTIAVHTHQTRGGQFIDVGVVDVADR
jgi:hypothetical protein